MSYSSKLWDPTATLRLLSVRLRACFYLASAGALAGGTFAYFTCERTLQYFVYGAADGMWIGILLSLYSLTILPGPLGRPIRQIPLFPKVLFNTCIYVALYFCGTSLARMMLGRPTSIPIDDQLVASVIYAIVLLTLVNFIVEMTQLAGTNAVINFISGIYHRPIEEDRVFLFVDLVGSTTLAEKIGNRGFMNFLNLFFACLSESVVGTDAEIYKYVGDEAILTWKTKDAVKHQNALRCFLLFQDYLEKAAPQFEKKFGQTPKVRAALHRGQVIAGELGDSRKEIAYLGDVVNSTARLMETARENGAHLVASEDFIKQSLAQSDKLSSIVISGLGTIEARDLGVIELRGKNVGMRAYAIDKKAA